MRYPVSVIGKFQYTLYFLFLYIFQKIPAPLWHNLGKAKTLKLLFWQCNLDSLKGDYVEFGVANGASMKAAILGHESAHSRFLGVRKVRRKFHGFDTFSKFESSKEIDFHSVWKGSRFSVEIDKVRSRFKKRENVFLHQMDVENLPHRYSNPKSANIDFASIVLFDMDLYAPTVSALNWIYPALQQGTFLIFDEFFAFHSRQDRGESLALSEFLTTHPEISLRHISNYGAGGIVFTVCISEFKN